MTGIRKAEHGRPLSSNAGESALLKQVELYNEGHIGMKGENG